MSTKLVLKSISHRLTRAMTLAIDRLCDGLKRGLLRAPVAVAAGGGSGVWREAEAVEGGTKCQDSHEKDSEMEVAELGHGGRVAVCVGDDDGESPAEEREREDDAG